jgi:chromosome segregation ATPase
MTATSTPAPTAPTTFAIDALFSRLADGPARVEAAADASASEAVGEFQPPPDGEGSDYVRKAYAWLQRERQRLERYTQAQFARIRGEQQATVEQNSFTEQALIFRGQELSRKEEDLNHLARALQLRADELAQREKELAPRLEPIWDAEAELAELRRLCAGLKPDLDGLRRRRDALRAEVEGLEREREALQRRRAASDKAEALFTGRRAEIEQRLLALDKAETAVQRRGAELEEFEERLRQDFEEQERRLAEERREIDALRTRLRAQCLEAEYQAVETEQRAEV